MSSALFLHLPATEKFAVAIYPSSLMQCSHLVNSVNYLQRVHANHHDDAPLPLDKQFLFNFVKVGSQEETSSTYLNRLWLHRRSRSCSRDCKGEISQAK